MSVTLMMFLYGKPGEDLGEGDEVTPDQLRALGRDVGARLEQAAEVVEKLTGAGWEVHVGLYDLMFSHPYINTVVQAEAKLQDLGIDPEALSIDEWEDEEEEPEPE